MESKEKVRGKKGREVEEKKGWLGTHQSKGRRKTRGEVREGKKG